MKFKQFNLKHIFYLFFASLLIVGCSSDDDGDTVNPEPVVEPIVLSCSTITEATVWENRGAGIDYILPCYLKIEAPLTIEPGVTIAFEQNGGLEITDYDTWTGSLKAVGTEEEPIVFTATNETPGAWNRIYLNSGDLNNKLHYCIIEFAGGTDGSKPALTALSGSKVEVQNTIIRNNKSDGVYISSSANIENWQKNTISNNQGYPMQIAARKIKFLDGNESVYTDNIKNQIYVNSGSIYNRGFIEDEIGGPLHVWQDAGIPYFIEENIYVRQDRENNVPGHLRITEGAEIIFAEEYGIQMTYNNTILEVLGTEEKPVTFSGLYGAGSWKGINITSSNSSQNLIENAIISDAGQSSWNWFENKGALSLGDQTSRTISLNVNNLEINNSAGCGIVERKLNGTSTITYNNITYTNVVNEVCDE